VGQQLLHLVDLGAELVELGQRAESPVDMTGVVDLVAEDFHGGAVDGASDGKPGA
jgi:hypothetical protein